MGDTDFLLWQDLLVKEKMTQWTDFTIGAMTGWKITKKLGIFAEMNYLQYWDRQVFTAKAGLKLPI